MKTIASMLFGVCVAYVAVGEILHFGDDISLATLYYVKACFFLLAADCVARRA